MEADWNWAAPLLLFLNGTPAEREKARAFALWLEFDDYAALSAIAYQDVQSLVNCIEYLRYQEGEKHLVFFTLAYYPQDEAWDGK
ncbi:MAG: hypothetical protein LAP85_07365 [Acidobacteriia bacterium]|nr:hypothetical protein [Terriglobia bacterium]